VQIGGRLVPPSQLSSTERQLSAAWLAASGSNTTDSNGSESHVTRDAGIGAAAVVAVALLVMSGMPTRRRHRLTPA
jgi:hypothetical protein